MGSMLSKWKNISIVWSKGCKARPQAQGLTISKAALTATV